jgi:hypothetical protein
MPVLYDGRDFCFRAGSLSLGYWFARNVANKKALSLKTPVELD